MIDEKLEDQQLAMCNRYAVPCMPAEPESKVGFALRTQGQLPLNGLRHPPQGDTNGWYLWYGEELSDDPTFFAPLHTKHLQVCCPEALKFLGLPPGYRFLVAGDYVDVWFDESLLNVYSCSSKVKDLLTSCGSLATAVIIRSRQSCAKK
jgi:hypothetical protein